MDTDALGALIAARCNVTPKRLAEPGPDARQLEQLLHAAAAAPDHGQLQPWRFVHVLPAGRERLGQAFRRALVERDAGAGAPQQQDAYDKAFRAPCLLLAVLDLSPRDKVVPPIERTISLGCAIQNMLLLATAMGYGSGLSSGQAMDSPALRQAFGLHDCEQAACFIAFGRVTQTREPRRRPATSSLLTTLPASD